MRILNANTTLTIAVAQYPKQSHTKHLPLNYLSPEEANTEFNTRIIEYPPKKLFKSSLKGIDAVVVNMFNMREKEVIDFVYSFFDNCISEEGISLSGKKIILFKWLTKYKEEECPEQKLLEYLDANFYEPYEVGLVEAVFQLSEAQCVLSESLNERFKIIVESN